MKLAIFGHARSGTTILTIALWKHLTAIGENEQWSHLGEVFNPNIYNEVVVSDGHLEMVRTEVDEHTAIPQMRETRFELFKSFSHHDYVVKFMSQDTKIPGIAEWMQDNYRIIAIERRNVLSAFLSSLIAFQYNVWHVRPKLGEQRPNYKPFMVEQHVMEAIGTHVVRYYQYRDQLNPTHILYYEDIANASQQDVLRMVDMVPLPSHSYKPPNTIKIHSFQEKMDLIQNLDAVVEHFMGIMVPYGVVMEHNDL